MFDIHVSVPVQRSQRVAYQIKQALHVVLNGHYALSCCYSVVQLGLKQFDRTNTLDFYVRVLVLIFSFCEEKPRRGPEPDVCKKRKRRTCCIVYGWAVT